MLVGLVEMKMDDYILHTIEYSQWNLPSLFQASSVHYWPVCVIGTCWKASQFEFHVIDVNNIVNLSFGGNA